MIRYFLLWLFVCAVFQADAQTYKEPDKYKVGISGGYNITTVHGSEMIEPRIKAGFSIGMYYRHQLSPRLHSMVEARTSFKGARFEASFDDEYERMDLVYIDFPLQLMVDLQKENKHLIFFGPQVSTLINSRVFIHQNLHGQGSYADYLHDDIDLKVLDFAAVLGYQYNGYYMGIHTAIKAGFFNINNGLNLEGVRQVTGTNGTIYNLALEVMLMF